jgi:hypothetical protein
MSAEVIVCTECGGSDITVDATVSWNVDKQEWDVDDVRDYNWCGDCDCEVGTDWKPTNNVRAAAINAIKKENEDGIPK